MNKQETRDLSVIAGDQKFRGVNYFIKIFWVLLKIFASNLFEK